MTSPIEKRCQGRVTRAFVTADTVDLLAAKMVGIIGERRMIKMVRYLGENPGTPRLFTGLRLWHGGYRDAVSVRPGLSVSVWLANQSQKNESLYFTAPVRAEDEQTVRDRWNNPEKQWLGQRRDITRVVLDGWPGEPRTDDLITIEHWNEHGYGQETTVVFDDIDLVQELAWDVKGDRERRMYLWDEFCEVHQLHFEHPDHSYDGCKGRQSTRAENLAVLAYLAERAQ